MGPLIRDTALRAASAGMAGVCLSIGIGFLTVAVWLALSALRGPVFAAGILAAIYGGAGLVLLAFALRRAPPIPERKPLPPLGEVFVMGVEAGRALRRPR